MKKETKNKLVNIYWIMVYSLAIIGLLRVLKYLVYGTFY